MCVCVVACDACLRVCFACLLFACLFVCVCIYLAHATCHAHVTLSFLRHSHAVHKTKGFVVLAVEKLSLCDESLTFVFLVVPSHTFRIYVFGLVEVCIKSTKQGNSSTFCVGFGNSPVWSSIWQFRQAAEHLLCFWISLGKCGLYFAKRGLPVS